MTMIAHEKPMTEREKGLRAVSVFLWTAGAGIAVGCFAGPGWGIAAGVVMFGLCQMGAPR
jgi:hypothetical protein